MEDLKMMCELTYDGGWGGVWGYITGKYTLHIDDVLATKLPEAPPIKVENIPEVCRSEFHEFAGERITRLSQLLFIRG